MEQNKQLILSEFNGFRQRVIEELSDYQFRNGFSPESALSGAFLVFSKNNGFKHCTAESRAQCLHDMLVFGLNPLKKHCYFIPFKDKDRGYILTFVMSFTGAIIAAKDANKTIKDVRVKLVKEGDDFDFTIEKGLYVIKKHNPTLESLEGKPIAAYALAVDYSDKIISLDIINYNQYVQHVRKTGKPIDGMPIVNKDGTFHKRSNHYRFPDQMFAKTIIHRLCKDIIKKSPNERVLVAQSRAADDHEADMIDEFGYQSEDYISEDKPLDFDDDIRVSEVESSEASTMASREQAELIAAIATEQGFRDQIPESLSEFFQRKINRISEMTMDEAEKFIMSIEGNSPYKKPDPTEPEETEDDEDDIPKPKWGNVR